MVLKFPSNLIRNSNDKTNFPRKLLFANNSSAKIKFLKNSIV